MRKSAPGLASREPMRAVSRDRRRLEPLSTAASISKIPQALRGAVFSFRCHPSRPRIDEMDCATGNAPYRHISCPAIWWNDISFCIAFSSHTRRRASEYKGLGHELRQSSAS